MPKDIQASLLLDVFKNVVLVTEHHHFILTHLKVYCCSTYIKNLNIKQQV